LYLCKTNLNNNISKQGKTYKAVRVGKKLKKMKIKSRFLSLMAIAIMLTLASTSCKEKKVAVTGVQLIPSTLTLEVDESRTLTVTVLPDNATDKAVTWQNSNDSVVSLNNGVVTALSDGTATITVTTNDGGIAASCIITVLALNPAEPRMVFVEGGTFMMGCTDEYCHSTEIPARQVTLSSFKIAKFETTQKQWNLVIGNNPSTYKGEDLPVESVNISTDIVPFLEQLNKITGKNYRLPTEAEWEYAARGGKQGINKKYRYSGSNDIDAVGWYFDNSGGTGISRKTQPVGGKEPNELGIYDMTGNVNEWCSDWYGLYKASPETDPQGPSSNPNNFRVYRGGSWFGSEADSHVTYRGAAVVTTRNSNTGFRVVLPCE